MLHGRASTSHIPQPRRGVRIVLQLLLDLYPTRPEELDLFGPNTGPTAAQRPPRRQSSAVKKQHQLDRSGDDQPARNEYYIDIFNLTRRLYRSCGPVTMSGGGGDATLFEESFTVTDYDQSKYDCDARISCTLRQPNHVLPKA